MLSVDEVGNHGLISGRGEPIVADSRDAMATGSLFEPVKKTGR